MNDLKEAVTAYKGTHLDGMLDNLNNMDEQLDAIQKSLDDIETKRQKFPRFYFLSNDDLLEILGQARDPMAVQPHVRKCFEAIKSLEMKEVGKEGKRVHEVSAMHSPEKETVPLTTTVVAAGAVEAWLLAVETAMCSTLSSLLFRCYSESGRPSASGGCARPGSSRYVRADRVDGRVHEGIACDRRRPVGDARGKEEAGDSLTAVRHAREFGQARPEEGDGDHHDRGARAQVIDKMIKNGRNSVTDFGGCCR